MNGYGQVVVNTDTTRSACQTDTLTKHLLMSMQKSTTRNCYPFTYAVYSAVHANTDGDCTSITQTAQFLQSVHTRLSNAQEGNLPVLLGEQHSLCSFDCLSILGMSNPTVVVENAVATKLNTMTCNGDTILAIS